LCAQKLTHQLNHPTHPDQLIHSDIATWGDSTHCAGDRLLAWPSFVASSLLPQAQALDGACHICIQVHSLCDFGLHRPYNLGPGYALEYQSLYLPMPEPWLLSPAYSLRSSRCLFSTKSMSGCGEWLAVNFFSIQASASDRDKPTGVSGFSMPGKAIPDFAVALYLQQNRCWEQIGKSEECDTSCNRGSTKASTASNRKEADNQRRLIKVYDSLQMSCALVAEHGNKYKRSQQRCYATLRLCSDAELGHMLQEVVSDAVTFEERLNIHETLASIATI